MTFIIPERDLPIDAVQVTDPTTGATYLAPRRRRKTPKAHNTVGPLPATCSTPFCEKAGLPHENDQCTHVALFDSYCSMTAPCVPIAGCTTYHRPVIPLPPTEPGPRLRADQDAFQRWLRSFPLWQVPREMPPSWTFPGHSQPQSKLESTQGRYTPYRSTSDLPHWEPVQPEYATPRGPPRGMQTPWPNVFGVMSRVPDVVEWNNVQGGTLQWTPQPWIAHPLPHPDVPAGVFWDPPGANNNSNLHQPWLGPGGWTPRYGMDAERMHMITGGHPLPGMNPYWTPTLWVPPLYSPQIGVYLSPWLAANPRDANVPHILWDAAVEPPYKIRRVTSRGAIVDFANTDFFKQPATHPAVKSLRINLPYMRSPWGPVIIDKDSPVTVGDIFNAVWEYLHKPITHSDWSAIRASQGNQRCKRIEYSMFRRCWNAAALYDYMFSQGIKRVDLMEGNTVYWGTYLTYNVDCTWTLTMGFLPRSRLA